MPRIITEDDSGYCEHWIAKTTSTSSGNSNAESPWNAHRNKAVIPKGQKIAVAFVTTTLILVIISLAVFIITKQCLPCHSTISGACPDFWIGYRRKCFYVSKEERNWSLSLETCSSFNASLAVIDTQKE
ncbi:Early activation antigen CD69, partial [Ophiophagus hannah]